MANQLVHTTARGFLGPTVLLPKSEAIAISPELKMGVRCGTASRRWTEYWMSRWNHGSVQPRHPLAARAWAWRCLHPSLPISTTTPLCCQSVSWTAPEVKCPPILDCASRFRMHPYAAVFGEKRWCGCAKLRRTWSLRPVASLMENRDADEHRNPCAKGISQSVHGYFV